ncbi:cytochrome P450 4F1-like [Ruditapes philippinarum]|uniref:cytochrome P450 4F1-like n=1 Tax=Ruditapes philippinarum TaxID=129788 RepID=UPI00295BA582|nr:cytochrome P450 4F1-like [Ruditapes philippinarum]
MEVSLILKTILFLLVSAVIYRIVLFLLHVRRITAIFKGAKGPEKCHWLFGSLVHFPKDGHDRMQYFLDICNKYGKEQGYVLLWGMFKKPLVIACSPRIMSIICKSNEPKSRGFVGLYRLLLPWLGEGLLVANGEKWARNRRLLTPAFHFEILMPYVQVFNESADILVEKLTKKAEEGKRFEVFNEVCLCTLDSMLRCAFSYTKNVQTAGETNEYVKAVNRLTCRLSERFLNPILLVDFFWNLTKASRQYKKDCEFVHTVSEEIIDKRQLELETGKPDKRRYVDFLDILLKAKDEVGNKLTRLEVRNEVDTFLFEGHDTTASAISWILFSLAENAECQRKCQKEIDELLRDRDSDDIEWSDLSKFEYLTMCIKEGMRLHAPVPIVGRDIENDFDLGDRVAPKGTLVQINIWALNHMEHIWGSDHMEFKPGRFSKENIDTMENFQFVPFSAGPRNCIGQNFAMNELKVVLSKLLKHFTFRLDTSHEVRKNQAAVMRTENGMYMFVDKRRS